MQNVLFMFACASCWAIVYRGARGRTIREGKMPQHSMPQQSGRLHSVAPSVCQLQYVVVYGISVFSRGIGISRRSLEGGQACVFCQGFLQNCHDDNCSRIAIAYKHAFSHPNVSPVASPRVSVARPETSCFGS